MSYTADEVKKALRDADNRVFPQPAPTNGQTVLASEVRRLRSVLANEVEHHVKRIIEVAAQSNVIIELGAKLNATKLREEGLEKVVVAIKTIGGNRCCPFRGNSPSPENVPCGECVDCAIAALDKLEAK